MEMEPGMEFAYSRQAGPQGPTSAGCSEAGPAQPFCVGGPWSEFSPRAHRGKSGLTPPWPVALGAGAVGEGSPGWALARKWSLSPKQSPEPEPNLWLQPGLGALGLNSGTWSLGF